MKRFLPIYIVSSFLFLSCCFEPAQAQVPPIKKLIKSISQRCEGKFSAISARLQTALTRQAIQSSKRAAQKPPLVFASLDKVSAYYGKMRHLPPFPLPQSDTELYRGMTLDASGQQLRHIFKYGLEVSKSHYTNLIAYDGHQYPDNQPAIYASPSLDLATSFTRNNTRFDKHIPVIIHLKRVSNSRIVSIPHDIPPSWIHRISALLTIKGKSTWGEIRLNEDGSFLFLPYPKP